MVITLTNDSPAGNWVVGYAMMQDAAGFLGGPLRGRRGQLRDSDAFIGIGAQTISCTVTNGSALIQSQTSDGFRTRGPRDIAAGTGLTGDTIVSAKTSDTEMTLSSPWTGATGTAAVAFRSDHSNYSVAFQMPVQ